MTLINLNGRSNQAAIDRIPSREPRPVLALLKEVSRAFAAMMTPETAVYGCLEIIARCAGWPIAHAYRRRVGDGAMVTMRTWFMASPTDAQSLRAFIAATEDIVVAAGVGPIGRAAAEGRSVTCPDITENPHRLQTAAARAIGVRSCFALPIVVENRVEIVLEFFARDQAEVDDSLSELMTFVAGSLAAAIKRDEHVRVLDAALLHMAPGLLMLDADLRVIVCNDAYRNMFEFTSERARPGVHLSDLIVLTSLNDGPNKLGVEEIMVHRRAAFAGTSPFSLQFAIADDRIIEGRYNPMMDGGWVATYTDITARHKAEARLTHMARHDALTDLPNRMLFHEHLIEILADAKARADGSEDEVAAVLCLDLDRFKAVNDTLGHATGDELLRKVTRRICDAVAGSTAVVARLGGDEFALLLPRVRPMQASASAKHLIDTVRQDYEIDGQRVNVGLSIGIALAPSDGDNPGQLLRAADMALYRAKSEGRGTFRFFEPEMDQLMQARRELELGLRQALAAGQFELHYQPLVRLDTDRISAFEALVRWSHPARGLVSPGEFIPLAEDIGLIVPLGEWVLSEACREASTWPSDVRVAVNLSPVQFHSPGIVASVAAAISQAGLDAHRLELEITEGVLLQDSDATLSILHQLKDLGVRIALDDFGTGYSSLSYLRAFPFDKIKIDRSFIANIANRADAVAIVRAVTSLGASLGIETTAEGVETPEQLERLLAEGCTEVQGFLFSRPIPAHNLSAMLAHDRDEARAGATDRRSAELRFDLQPDA